MKNKIDISVLMPVYNPNIEWFAKAVDSILFQKYPQERYELVIVNDGTTDEATLTYLSGLDKERVKVIGQKNMGIGFSLNHGLEHCDGDLIVRMDADDIALPALLSRQFSFMKNDDIFINGISIQMFGGLFRVSKLPAVVTRRSAKEMEGHWVTCHPGVCFRKDWFVDEIGGYIDCGIGLAEDYPTWIKVLRMGYEIHNQPDILMYYRSRKPHIPKVEIWGAWLQYWKNLL